MACGCDQRRIKIANWLKRLIKWLGPKWSDVSNDANTVHLETLKKLGLKGTGPAAGDIVDKKIMMYQQIGTWVIEYDANTMNTISAKFRLDEFPL